MRWPVLNKIISESLSPAPARCTWPSSPWMSRPAHWTWPAVRLISSFCIFMFLISIPDGWTKNDLVYVWKEGNPVQLAGNLSLPGGFKLGAFGSQYCDVITATGQ